MKSPAEKKISIAEFGVELRLTEAVYGVVKMVAAYTFAPLPKGKGGVEYAAALFTIACTPKNGSGQCVITSPTIQGDIRAEGITEAIITAAQHGRVWATMNAPYTAIIPRTGYSEKAAPLSEMIRKAIRRAPLAAKK